jgi:hypothetical protein
VPTVIVRGVAVLVPQLAVPITVKVPEVAEPEKLIVTLLLPLPVIVSPAPL